MTDRAAPHTYALLGSITAEWPDGHIECEILEDDHPEAEKFRVWYEKTWLNRDE